MNKFKWMLVKFVINTGVQVASAIVDETVRIKVRRYLKKNSDKNTDSK